MSGGWAPAPRPPALSESDCREHDPCVTLCTARIHREHLCLRRTFCDQGGAPPKDPPQPAICIALCTTRIQREHLPTVPAPVSRFLQSELDDHVRCRGGYHPERPPRTNSERTSSNELCLRPRRTFFCDQNSMFALSFCDQNFCASVSKNKACVFFVKPLMNRHYPKRCSIPFSLHFLALFLHHHFRLTDLDP